MVCFNCDTTALRTCMHSNKYKNVLVENHLCRPIINGKFEEKTCGEGPSLSTMFDDDRHLQGLVNNIRVILHSLILIMNDVITVILPGIVSCHWSYLCKSIRRLWPQPLMLQISMRTHLNHTASSTEKMNNVTWKLSDSKNMVCNMQDVALDFHLEYLKCVELNRTCSIHKHCFEFSPLKLSCRCRILQRSLVTLPQAAQYGRSN